MPLLRTDLSSEALKWSFKDYDIKSANCQHFVATALQGETLLECCATSTSFLVPALHEEKTDLTHLRGSLRLGGGGQLHFVSVSSSELKRVDATAFLADASRLIDLAVAKCACRRSCEHQKAEEALKLHSNYIDSVCRYLQTTRCGGLAPDCNSARSSTVLAQ